MRAPKTAYILLWFPKPSETFIFREVVNLEALGLPIGVFTLYGELKKHLSPEMASLRTEIERLGIRRLIQIAASLFYWWKNNGPLARRLIRTVPFRKWRSLEVAGENIWAFFCGFYLARRFQERGIEHIHAPWANGPATAAWIASKLTGIPFSFTGRAVDIHPPDGALEAKMADAAFIRTNTATNVAYLENFLTDRSKKIHLTYNGYPLKNFQPAPVTMEKPLRILAVGRFARFKGFNVLLKSAAMLKKEKQVFRLVIAGSGWRMLYFKLFCLCHRLSDNVSFPGFIAHDRISDFYAQADIFVLPSVIHPSGERDGIPNVLMEALLHGLPVVCTSLASFREVIENEISGLLVPPGDASALKRAIIKMADNRERALNLARNGKRKVQERFDPDKNHRQLLEIYRQSFSPPETTI